MLKGPNRRWSATALAVSGLIAASALTAPAAAAIVYQNLPTSLATPPNISWHNANGPVIADDFISATGGHVNALRWWGSLPNDRQALWEVVLQNNNPALGQPANTPPGNNVTGGLKQLVSATITPTAIQGIYQFDAAVGPGWTIAAGVDYWLTVANSINGWNWAEALGGPTIGSELFNAHTSTGPGCLDGGPHCGPWTDLHTDFAFQISSVPEPASWAMLIIGFGVVGATSRRRRRQVIAA